MGSLLESRCAREARLNAGESPVGAIRRFSTADRANCVAARRGGEQAWSRTVSGIHSSGWFCLTARVDGCREV
jgi:hypothetical protein